MRNELRSALLLSLLVAGGCGVKGPTASTPGAGASATSQVRQVVFADGTPINVELAVDDDTREQGLMYRDRLADNSGMIFIFPTTSEYAFWMKNTLIPLDMIWIDEGRKIVHVAHDVPPCKADPCPSYPPGAQAKYVLEVAGGVAAKHHVEAGQAVRFEGLDQVVVR